VNPREIRIAERKEETKRSRRREGVGGGGGGEKTVGKKTFGSIARTLEGKGDMGSANA